MDLVDCKIEFLLAHTRSHIIEAFLLVVPWLFQIRVGSQDNQVTKSSVYITNIIAQMGINCLWPALWFFHLWYSAGQIFFFGQMNIQIFVWPQNLTNICMNEYICLESFKYFNIFEYLKCKHSKNWKNECLIIFVALKFIEYFEKWIYSLRNILIFKNI